MSRSFLYDPERERWEQRYAPFTFHQASWSWRTKDVVAIVRESKQLAPENWHGQGISHRYIGFGVPFGEHREAIACLSIVSYHYSLPFPRDWHPELFTCLDQYEPEELLHLVSLAQQNRDNPTFAFPPFLFAGRREIHWRIPQRLLQPGEKPLQISTFSAAPASMDRYYALCERMRQLGPRSMLIDLRDAPCTHKELQRRQHLKRNTFTWPKERAGQCLHPIELRQAFGMKYRQIPGIVHFAHINQRFDTDAQLERHAKVWLYQPEMCAPLVDLIMRRHPLLLLDEDQLYETSLRRAIVLHLLSLFSTQLEIIQGADDLAL